MPTPRTLGTTRKRQQIGIHLEKRSETTLWFELFENFEEKSCLLPSSGPTLPIGLFRPVSRTFSTVLKHLEASTTNFRFEFFEEKSDFVGPSDFYRPSFCALKPANPVEAIGNLFPHNRPRQALKNWTFSACFADFFGPYVADLTSADSRTFFGPIFG